MVSGELENSLRARVDEYVSSRLSGMQEEITRLQAQVNEAFARLTEQSRGGGEADADISATISEVIRAAHERGLVEAAAESPTAKASSDMAIIKAAVEDISEQHSQAEILTTLVNRAASFAPRIAFFVIKNDQAIGWRARGLEGSVGDDAIREIALPLSADTPLSDVVRSRTAWSGQPGSNAEDYLLLNKLGSEPPQRMVAIPLVARGKAAAVLYADSAALDAEAINLEALETLMRVAGMAVELTVTARSAGAQQPARTEAPAAAPEPEAGQEEAAEQPGYAETQTPAEAPEVREDETPTVEVQALPTAWQAEGAPAHEDYAATPPTSQSSEAAWSQPAPTTPAEQWAGAETPAEQPAEQAPGSYSAPLGGARRYGRAADAADLPVEVESDDERRLHNDARRFARLLVSEIKLYNQKKVEEGRAEGDLYDRLREDIDRSRQMYDKRVAPPVAARYDYFHQELVNTLAEGDPSKLGGGYPGAAV